MPFLAKDSAVQKPKISAYLSIYNDADILEAALKSVENYVDELIVVDGAYEWMAPFLEATGRNPLRSDESVYEKLRGLKIPYKVINRLWKNEVEKRSAGYAATTSRFVMRVDADEVIFFDDQQLQNFFASGCAVAEMYMPNYVAPGLVIQGQRLVDKFRKFPRQSCLFDREKISAQAHLRYLWLVLTADDLPNNEQERKIYSVFEKPIAFCSHLTNWRYVDSGASRSSFYIMNWMRKNGAPWVAGIRPGPLANFDEFFKLIPPERFLEIMKNGEITQGDIQLKPTEKLSSSPLSSHQESVFVRIYQNFLEGLKKRTLIHLHEEGVALSGFPFYLDISSQEVLATLAPNGSLNIEFSEPIDTTDVWVQTLQRVEPYSASNRLVTKVKKNVLEIRVSDVVYNQEALRKVIKLQVSAAQENMPWLTFRIVAG